MNPSFVKSFFYIIKKNPIPFLKFFIKNPLKSIFKFTTSPFMNNYTTKNDTHYFGFKDISELNLKETILLVSFSYCQKHPSCKVRFTKNCINCQKCSIGTWKTFLNNENFKIPVHFSITTTALSLAEELIDLIIKHPKKKILFYISACPFSINMFKKFPYILGIQGVASPLSKNTCQDFTSFEKAENGIKPHSTYFNEDNFQKFITSLKNF